MEELKKGMRVINRNDLETINLNGSNVVISMNLYTVLNPIVDEGGYISVQSETINKNIIGIKSGSIIPVYS